MTVTVRLFARAKDLAGTDVVHVDLPAGATVGRLRSHLARTFPNLAGLLSRCAFAVDDEFATDALPLEGCGEVAVLPPVSGGEW